MNNFHRKAIAFAIVALTLALPIRAAGQELSKEAQDKAAAEARAKRNAQTLAQRQRHRVLRPHGQTCWRLDR